MYNKRAIFILNQKAMTRDKPIDWPFIIYSLIWLDISFISNYCVGDYYYYSIIPILTMMMIIIMKLSRSFPTTFALFWLAKQSKEICIIHKMREFKWNWNQIKEKSKFIFFYFYKQKKSCLILNYQLFFCYLLIDLSFEFFFFLSFPLKRQIVFFINLSFINTIFIQECWEKKNSF